MTNDDGLIINAMRGLVPGVICGGVVGSARAYLSGLSYSGALGAIPASRTTAPLKTLLSTTVLFASVGTLYTTAEPIAAGMRGKNDALNGAVAGCVAGSAVGLRNGNVQAGLGACAAFAAMSTFVEVVSHGNDKTVVRRKAVYGVVEDKKE